MDLQLNVMVFTSVVPSVLVKLAMTSRILVLRCHISGD
jgi:hypothetical protein